MIPSISYLLKVQTLIRLMFDVYKTYKTLYISL